jgi:hypothetical protein
METEEERHARILEERRIDVVRCEEDLVEARKVYDRAHVENREAAKIHKAMHELAVAKNQLEKARLKLTGWEDALVAEDERKKLREPPSLQKLVEAHAVYDDTGKMIGGYDRITPEAWAKFDADMAEWKARIRFGEFPPKRI